MVGLNKIFQISEICVFDSITLLLLDDVTEGNQVNYQDCHVRNQEKPESRRVGQTDFISLQEVRFYLFNFTFKKRFP